MSVEILGNTWLAFTLRTSTDWARRRFEQRFGYEPLRVRNSRGLLLVGPVGERFLEEPAEEPLEELQELGPEILQEEPEQLELFT
jgi:hypothetical protein